MAIFKTFPKINPDLKQKLIRLVDDNQEDEVGRVFMLLICGLIDKNNQASVQFIWTKVTQVYSVVRKSKTCIPLVSPEILSRYFNIPYI